MRRTRSGWDDPVIDRHTAEQLLNRTPAAAQEHGALNALLAAATGPARPDEIAGERAAVSAFTREYRPCPRPRTLAPRPGRGAGIAVTVSVAALLVGGTAYAAGTGRLPDALQELLPGAAAPVSDHAARTAPTDQGTGRAAPTPRPSTGPVPQPSATVPVAAAELERLCRAWTAFRADPHAGQVTAEERHALASAAGGENDINGFCQRLLDPTPQPSATTGKPGNPSPGAGKPSHPGRPQSH
ncbi:hypothetical protein AB0K00_17205 [Dactylosporangium sp. NPDC049525]|uniref:hypothetical protein n=1 Tax=Dactylosporangium sp. NPDC049525 TaxID=3154730 RepID=UPI003431BA08